MWVISKAKRTFAVFYFLASDGVMVTDKHLLIMKTLQLSTAVDQACLLEGQQAEGGGLW